MNANGLSDKKNDFRGNNGTATATATGTSDDVKLERVQSSHGGR